MGIANSLPRSAVAVRNVPFEYCEMATPRAISMDKTVRSGMSMAVFKRVLRSMNVATHPLLFPRLETIVSSSSAYG